MFYSVQLDEAAFRVDMVNALQISSLRDYERNTVAILPTLANLPNNENFILIESAPAFVGLLPNWESAASIRWSYAFANTFMSGEQAETNWVRPAWASAEYSAHEGKFNLVCCPVNTFA